MRPQRLRGTCYHLERSVYFPGHTKHPRAGEYTCCSVPPARAIQPCKISSPTNFNGSAPALAYWHSDSLGALHDVSMCICGPMTQSGNSPSETSIISGEGTCTPRLHGDGPGAKRTGFKCDQSGKPSRETEERRPTLKFPQCVERMAVRRDGDVSIVSLSLPLPRSLFLSPARPV